MCYVNCNKKKAGVAMLISGKWTLSQRILLDTRVTFHNDKRISAAGRYNNDKYMYLITELQNT